MNPGTRAFERSLNSEIYVDKSGLIEKNKFINKYAAAVYLRESSEAFWKIYGG